MEDVGPSVSHVYASSQSNTPAVQIRSQGSDAVRWTSNGLRIRRFVLADHAPSVVREAASNELDAVLFQAPSKAILLLLASAGL